MPNRFAVTRHAQAKPVAACDPRTVIAPLAIVAGTLLVSVLLAGCSSGSESGFSLFADPGKYQFYNCAQLATERKTLTHRQQELKSLIDRADQSAGGAAVGLIAYKGEYVNASEELGLLQSVARSKQCEQDEAWRSSTVIR
jgi:hypothetical protein